MKKSLLLLVVLSGFGTLALMGCKQPTVADLTVSATTVPSTAVHASTVWPLGATIANQGSADAPASTIQYWFSSDAVLDFGDTLVRSSPVPVLPPSAAYVDPPVDHSVSEWGAGSGTHYIIIVADASGVVTESNKTNNTTITPVVVTGNPDLTVTAVQAPATPVGAADTWALGATVTNAGTGDAPATKVTFYLSGDNAFGSDTLIGSSDVPFLAAGAAADVTYSASYSISAPGTYWIFAVVDPDSTILEGSEDNNRASTKVAVKYPRVIIDTYKWSSGAFGTTNTFLSLFDRNGDPTADTSPTLWNDDAAPYTVDAPPLSIAEDDDGNPTFAQFARIDYSAGLAPGTYYIRVRGYVSTEVGPYAIRVLTDINPLDQYPVEWFFAGPNYTDAPYETDDNPKSGGVPTNPVAISIGQAHNRYLQAAGDVDWFVLTLP